MSQSGNYEGVNSQGNSYTSYEGDKNEYSYSNQDGSSYYNDGIKKLFLSIGDIFIMVSFQARERDTTTTTNTALNTITIREPLRLPTNKRLIHS